MYYALHRASANDLGILYRQVSKLPRVTKGPPQEPLISIIEFGEMLRLLNVKKVKCIARN